MSENSTNNQQQKLGGEFHGLAQLKVGERYTLLTQGIFGAIASKMTLVDVKVVPYAQYSESVKLIFKVKGKRKLSGCYFYGRESCVVWQGWVDVDTNFLKPAEVCEATGMTVRKSKYTSCDSRHFDDAVKSVTASPVFSRIHEFINTI